MKRLEAVAMDNLSDLEWNNRVIIIFGNADNAKANNQVELLTQQEPELSERDLVLIRVTDIDAHMVYGTASKVDPTALKSEAGISDGLFHVVLVGKDGTIKLRAEEVVDSVKIFEIIDRMPMRRNEKQ